MTKETLEKLFSDYNQEQVALAAEVQKKSALIQQLEGKKQLLQEMHQQLVKAEGKIAVMPDPPKDEQADNQTPAT